LPLRLRDAANQRDRDDDAGARREEVLHRQPEHLLKYVIVVSPP